MRKTIATLAVALAVTGCNSTQLRFTTTRQIATVSDTYVEVVLENLARMATDPSIIPFFTMLDSGNDTITDKGALSGFINFPAQSVVKQLHRQRGGQIGPLSGERDIAGNWTIKPISDPDRLKAMRCLYLHVLNQPVMDKGDTTPGKCLELLQRYLGPTFDWSWVPNCWFQCGRWRDVPKGAKYVLHHHGTYCWVVPGREEEVTKLTLAILDIATKAPATMSVEYTHKINANDQVKETAVVPTNSPIVIPIPSQVQVPKTLRDGSVVMEQVTLPTTNVPVPNFVSPNLRMDTTPAFSPGLFFVPR